MERLDKLLARELNMTRSQAKALIKDGSVTVNGALASSGEIKCGEDDEIIALGKRVSQKRYVYIMMHKPQGFVSATEDTREKTVIDLLPVAMRRRGLFPAGRLDKDTTGFLLITDDGDFAHRILSPSKHIPKTYIATLDKPFTDEVRADFERGMALGTETLQPAELHAQNSDNTVVLVVIREGIYHQIKRMFQKHGITVTALKRIAMGALELDSSLAEGECRYLTDKEIAELTASR